MTRRYRETTAAITDGPSEANLDLLRMFYEAIGLPRHHADTLVAEAQERGFCHTCPDHEACATGTPCPTTGPEGASA